MVQPPDGLDELSLDFWCEVTRLAHLEGEARDDTVDYRVREGSRVTDVTHLRVVVPIKTDHTEHCMIYGRILPWRILTSLKQFLLLWSVLIDRIGNAYEPRVLLDSPRAAPRRRPISRAKHKAS